MKINIPMTVFLWMGVICLLFSACSSQPKEITITFDKDTCLYSGPKVVAAGEVAMTLDVKDTQYKEFAVYLLHLNAGKTVEDLRAWPSTDPPEWVQIVNWGAGFAGKSNRFVSKLSAGEIFIACFRSPPEAKIGALGPITVK